jgi:HEAT repeat protein
MGIRDMTRVRGLALDGDVRGLILVLRDRSRSGPERRVAAAALGDLHDKRAVEPLVSVLDDTKVCATAVRALAAIGDPIAAAPLAELYSSSGDRGVRKEAEKALYGLSAKDPRGVRSVLESYERAKNRRGWQPKHE